MHSSRAQLLDLIDAVFATNGGLAHAGNRLGRQAGLTSAQWQVLGLLEHDSDTVASIARRRGLTRQSVQQSADRLLAAGFVKRTPNPRDRRAPLLTLTQKGEAALGVASRASDLWLSELVTKFEATELDVCLRVLRHLRAQLGVPPRGTDHREDAR